MAPARVWKRTASDSVLVVAAGPIDAEVQMRRRAEPRIAGAREPLPARDALADSDLHAAALEMEVLARRAVGVQHDQKIGVAAALLARATRVVRVLDEYHDAVARGMHGRADGHAEIQSEPLRTAVAQPRAVALDDRKAHIAAVRQAIEVAVVMIGVDTPELHVLAAHQGRPLAADGGARAAFVLVGCGS